MVMNPIVSKTLELSKATTNQSYMPAKVKDTDQRQVHERLPFKPPMLRYIVNQNTKNETNDIILQGKKATVMHINTELYSLHGTVLSKIFPSSFVNNPIYNS